MNNRRVIVFLLISISFVFACPGFATQKGEELIDRKKIIHPEVIKDPDSTEESEIKRDKNKEKWRLFKQEKVH